MTSYSFSFSHAILLISKPSRQTVSVISSRQLMTGRFSKYCRPLLASPQLRYFANPHRGYTMIIGRILKGALKIRYLLLGGAVGGGVTLQKVNKRVLSVYYLHILFKYILTVLLIFKFKCICLTTWRFYNFLWIHVEVWTVERGTTGSRMDRKFDAYRTTMARFPWIAHDG